MSEEIDAIQKENIEKAKRFKKETERLKRKDAWPDHLKDPANFNKIQIALLETLATTHSHAEMINWAKCFDCMQKLKDHATMMKKLGFKSPAMYAEWKKRHTIITKRDPIQ